MSLSKNMRNGHVTLRADFFLGEFLLLAFGRKIAGTQHEAQYVKHSQYQIHPRTQVFENKHHDNGYRSLCSDLAKDLPSYKLRIFAELAETIKRRLISQTTH
jgi:hypothetical protein